MTEWTEEQLLAQGYYENPDPSEQSAIMRRLARNDQARDTALDKSGVAKGYRGRIAGPPGPVVHAEAVTPRTEVERLLRPGLAWQPAGLADPRLVRIQQEQP